MAEAGHDPFSGAFDVVRQILDVVDAVADAYPEDTIVALPMIANLIVGKKLGEEHWSETKLAEGFVWRPVVPRSVQVGDVVRVRQDAYSDPEMARHNGLQGRVNAIRNGIYVIYDSANTRVTQMGVRHTLEALERRVALPPQRAQV